MLLINFADGERRGEEEATRKKVHLAIAIALSFSAILFSILAILKGCSIVICRATTAQSHGLAKKKSPKQPPPPPNSWEETFDEGKTDLLAKGFTIRRKKSK